ncbi:hypothetical protein I7I50_03093 [Histoplasma capsulatum G186AR]|uniref:Uncharacterized protein n=1 Tax=Ajellomyces capsulatus TaxID=5037 RepID=A0A8H7Z1K7_AJECA|nr:hypothetical protein I7I52_00241 [Histoplasma capsulatum]QSS72040.1 hypothetical protein I7I50_03093 [Histoplasma capsulatum G186AR]
MMSLARAFICRQVGTLASKSLILASVYLEFVILTSRPRRISRALLRRRTKTGATRPAESISYEKQFHGESYKIR